MKLLITIIVLLMMAISCQSLNQNQDIYVVRFNFHHSRRIPDNFVSVNIDRYGDSISVKVKSIPMDTISTEWRLTKREYVFELSNLEFNKIVSAVQKINCMDITKGLGFSGKDGSICEIEIGGIGTGITYKVWSPTYETKERNLQPFLDACKLILLTAKLDHKIIL